MSSDRHDQAFNVFAAAAEMNSQERKAYLTRVCGDDDTLREEVESLLKYDGDGTIIPELQSAPTAVPILTVASKYQRRAITTPFLIGVTLLLAVMIASGCWLHYRMKGSLEQLMVERLETILESDVVALEHWIEVQKSFVIAWADEPRIQQSVAKLMEEYSAIYRGSKEEDESVAKLRDNLNELLSPVIARKGYRGYGVISRDGTYVAGSNPQLIGESVTPHGAAYVSRLNRGEVVFAIPSRQRSFVVAIQTTVQDPVLAVAAPILGTNGRVIGALSFGFDADEECTRALAQTNFGQTGETFAFDKDAVLLSNIRNRDDLEDLGLLEANQQCALHVEVRIPPAPMHQHDTAIRPLTAMAAHAIGGNTGTNVKGYTNFAGKKVVGAWTWLPEYDFGVGTEINYSEAYGPLSYIVRSFAFLIGVVSVLSIGIISSSLRIFQLQKRIDGEQFGAYRLGEKIGEGGMGEVYKAFHNRLQRPAAVKLLTNTDGNPNTTARFEREVQLTCSLTHPNTIQVFDFGISTGGVFYYAMELLDGRTVQQIVEATGTICPARTVHILQQVCGSLQEAHEKGLIHRDIKPSNIMVSQRAGLSDFVTVLDFGIAKPIEPSAKQDVTRTELVIGTPHFMAPERVIAPESVDARSDIFSLGAVAFYMLVGRHPFEGDNSIEILRQSTACDGLAPSSYGNQNIPDELDRLIHDCLSRDPDSRPQTMSVISHALYDIASQHEWTQGEATDWWGTYLSR